MNLCNYFPKLINSKLDKAEKLLVMIVFQGIYNPVPVLQ